MLTKAVIADSFVCSCAPRSYHFNYYQSLVDVHRHHPIAFSDSPPASILPAG
jgi:hypothetical protein